MEELVKKQKLNFEVELRGQGAKAQALAQELERTKTRCAELRGAILALANLQNPPAESEVKDVEPVKAEKKQEVPPIPAEAAK